MDRVWIRGTSGSGKTTLGLALAARLGVPAVDLDELHWLPEWRTRPREEFRSLLDEATANPRWVVAGNYTNSAGHLEGIVDTFVWLDYSLPVTFGRILRRTVCRIATCERCCNGNREAFRTSFLTRESVIWWCLTTHGRRHRECLAFMAQTPPPGQTRLRHRSPNETRQWLDELRRP